MEKEAKDYFNNKEYEKALALYLVLEQDSKEKVYYQTMIGMMYQTIHYDLDKSLYWLTKAQSAGKNNPDYKSMIFGLAYIYYKKKEYDKAISFYNHIQIENKSDKYTICYYKASIYFNQSNYYRALYYYDKCINLFDHIDLNTLFRNKPKKTIIKQYNKVRDKIISLNIEYIAKRIKNIPFNLGCIVARYFLY